jgi:hypothetical protein
MFVTTKLTLLLANSFEISKPCQHIFEQYFFITRYQREHTHDPRSTIVYFDCCGSFELYQSFLDQNFLVVIDNLFENKSFCKKFFSKLDPEYFNKTFLLHNVNWFWYHESLLYSYHGYNKYIPNKTYQHLALMPMGLGRPHRNSLYQSMQPWLDQLVWSYLAIGKRLPNDQEGCKKFIHDLGLEISINDRFFNPDWYDSTYFSLIAETEVDSYPDQPVFITEKTFKPIAFQHPFLIFGNAGTLKHLHNLGFETYDNLFNESYDTCQDSSVRLSIILENIKNFKTVPYDQLTQKKILHNSNKFFDLDVVTQRIIKEIIEPILEYANL